MAEHPNMAWMYEMRDMWNAGDFQGFLERCSDDIVARVGGNSPLAGTYRGRAEYMGYLGRLAGLSDGNPQVSFEDLLAGDRYGAAVLMGSATRARDGATIDMKTAFAFRFDDEGRWKEVWYLPADQAAWDDFWS